MRWLVGPIPPLRNQLRIDGHPAFDKSYRIRWLESLGICDRRFLPGTGHSVSGPCDLWKSDLAPWRFVIKRNA